METFIENSPKPYSKIPKNNYLMRPLRLCDVINLCQGKMVCPVQSESVKKSEKGKRLSRTKGVHFVY